MCIHVLQMKTLTYRGLKNVTFCVLILRETTLRKNERRAPTLQFSSANYSTKPALLWISNLHFTEEANRQSS